MSKHEKEKVDFVITVCADQVLQVVAQVSEMLNLPCYIDYETAKNVSDKIKNDGIYVLDLNNTRDVQIIDKFTKGKILLRDFYKNSDISKYWCSTKPSKKLLYYLDALDDKKYPDVLD